MRGGGIFDQIGFGFHRYSTDEAWIIPHFEKMTDDNAGLLKNYVDGYAVLGEDRFRTIAENIISYTKEVLSDPSGGFYASQDADVTPDDEGGYFTWTAEEFRDLLSGEEYEILSEHFFDDRGIMHHDPAKRVLSLSRDMQSIAERMRKTPGNVRTIIESGKSKLLRARETRPAPFIDKARYTSLNGMMVAAYFHAFAVLGDEHVKKFGIASLEWVLQNRLIQGKLLHTEDVPALLSDVRQLLAAS